MSHKRIFQPTRALLALIAIVAIFLFFQFGQREDEDLRSVEISTRESWYDVYFTDPRDANASSLRGGPDEAIVEAIDAAQYSVDVAIYHLDLWSIRDALIRAHRRGVRVRVVTESDNILEPEIADLEAAGIQILGDRREHLMHHKFIVIDRMEVWTGSMNFTVRGAYSNNNNLLRIRADKIAQDYTREFEEMFTEDRFGALSRVDTPYPNVELNGASIEVYFSPDDGVEKRLIDLIGQAQHAIDFMAFTLTSDEMADAILAQAEAGVKVRGVFETSQASAAGGEYERLREAGLDVRLDGNRGSMHHKVFVIDGEVLITGSYNFTRSAEERNDENVLVVFHADLVQEYLLEFEHLYEVAKP